MFQNIDSRTWNGKLRCFIFFGDNQGRICLPKNQITNELSKNIYVKYHSIRYHIDKGNIKF